jgi:hypothetical protein
MSMSVTMKINPDNLVRNAKKWLTAKVGELQALEPGRTVDWLQMYGKVKFQINRSSKGGLVFAVEADPSFSELVPTIEDALREVADWFDNTFSI